MVVGVIFELSTNDPSMPVGLRTGKRLTNRLPNISLIVIVILPSMYMVDSRDRQT